MSRFVRLIVPLVALGAGAAIVAGPGGCQRSAPASSATVRGTVTFRGQPLSGGLVIFSPDPDRGGSGKPARGEIGPDGQYQLSLASSPTIPPGWYRVAIVALPRNPASGLDGSAFPAELARPDLSRLIREVQPSQENVFHFAIELAAQ